MNITNAGVRGYNPIGVVIHNDAGSNGANTGFYKSWLPNHDPENGFAHVYIASDGRLQASDFSNMAWHCANSYGNANYASWEVCQSEGDLSQFLRNEQAVLDDVAKYMKQWGLTPNHDTVKLHQELSATSCPRRSVEVHGGTVESCRSYFITELNKRITGRNTNTNTNTEKRKYKMFAIYSDGSNKQLYILNVATGKESKITNDERKAILADNVMKEMVVDFGKANRTSLGKSNEALKKFR
ncbi:lysin [Lactococcus phage 936 group phage Phi17]|uniref:Lysin n=3 Tax=Skunavirus TaxID=1623305 RepID=A0A126HDI7_9CAUD|nr:endolysin [Lactococcus phage 936 group phage PhiM1127]ALM63692.1 lysin [Lactococcus phage 936 group phage Phi17]ALM64366.1 lysin [Lactococcus phage 936 group phage Phi40]ALM64650.1 lysin [Lactococcus phage 936 group phage PhiM1127]ALM64811.1 lysin [Lactococcus phage 936 group phage Phi.16]